MMSLVKMRQIVFHITKRLQPLKVCKYCASRHVTTESTKWKLATAVCVERYPVITQEMNDIERRFNTMMEEYDVEKSLLSEHEEQMRLDAILAQMKKEREERDDVIEGQEVSTVTALDKEDEWEAELNAYQFLQNRVTEADKNNDMKSTRRKLDRKLILIVQKKINDKLTWLLPQEFYQEEESLKQAAENVLSSNFGDSIKSGIFGNSPHGFYQYQLPKEVTEEIGASGVKVFIFRAEYKGGKVLISDKDVTDYKWVTLDELSEYLYPRYHKKLKKFVLEI